MNEPQFAAQSLQQAFNRIHQEQMVGIPILNNRLKVQTLGFQEFGGRIIGVLITPWLMNLVMLPGKEDDWRSLEPGEKQLHPFPSKTVTFMINEIDGIGKCLTHSLFSPMHEFVNQDHARVAAQSFLATLMVEAEPIAGRIVDDELLGRILRGEETPGVDHDDFAVIEAMQTATPVRGASAMALRVEKKCSRRDLLRGGFLRDA